MNNHTLTSIVESPVTALLLWPVAIFILLAYEFSRVAPGFVRGRRILGAAAVPVLLVFVAVIVGRFVLLHD